MIDFLELYERIEVNLRFGPSPEEVPAALKIHSMRKLKPILCSVERCVDDIVDFRFVLHYSIEQIIVLSLFQVIFCMIF